MSFVDDPESYYYNDESLDDVEDGDSSPFYFDDELEQAHAEEQAAGWSSEDDDENDTHEQASFQNNNNHNNPPRPSLPLHRHPIHAGEGDIGAAALRKPALVQKQPSQTTSMLPPSEYAAMRESQRQRRLPSCCESPKQRLRYIGGLLSAAGVFTLGFMLVLLGNMWYEKNNPSEDSSGDTTKWQIVEVVTYFPAETSAPIETGIADRPVDDKSTNLTGIPSLPPMTAPQLYTLHQTQGYPVQLELQAGGNTKKVYSTVESMDSFSCTTNASVLLLHLPGMASVSSSAATVSSIALQLELVEDSTIVVCDDDTVEAVYHHVFLNSVDSTKNVTEVRFESWLPYLVYVTNC